MAKALSKYKVELERMGLTQLDVYRYPDHDEIRVKTHEGDVVLIKLPSHREAMNVEEFKDYMAKELKRARGAKKKR